MQLIDRCYTAAPFLGVRKMAEYLAAEGQKVNVKRVRRLIRQMGLQAI